MRKIKPGLQLKTYLRMEHKLNYSDLKLSGRAFPEHAVLLVLGSTTDKQGEQLRHDQTITIFAMKLNLFNNEKIPYSPVL